MELDRTPRRPGDPILGVSGRALPTNLQAEQALLGAILANNKGLESVAERLLPEHFADPVHEAIYRACLTMVAEGKTADAITLRNRFEHNGILDEAGGTAYLAQLLTAMVSVNYIGEYANAIIDAWQRRQIIEAGDALINLAFDGSMLPAEAVARSLSMADAALGGVDAERKAQTLDDAMDAAIAAADEAEAHGGPTGEQTGFPGLDRALKGLQPDHLIILGGRPGMGKTSLAVQIALQVARDAKVDQDATGERSGVLFVSLEQSARELGAKILATEAKMPVERLQLGQHGQHANQLVAARRRLHGLPYLIEDVPGQTIRMLKMKVRAAKRRLGRIRMIVVDHIHIVPPEDADRRHGTTQNVGQVSNALKVLAKEYRCPVIALSQLSRKLEEREDKRPIMSDLRYAGEIEQDADIVMFVYRHEYYLQQQGETPPQRANETPAAYGKRVNDHRDDLAKYAGKAEVIIAKHRHGKATKVHLRFNGDTTSFWEPEAHADEAQHAWAAD